jgi:hypothetical protein
MEAVFTASGRLTRPNGASLVGPEAIAVGQSQSFARFRAPHHVSSDHIIDLDGDSARLRANLIAMHLWADQERDPNTLQTHFLTGGVLHALLVRTNQGWRLSELSAQYLANRERVRRDARDREITQPRSACSTSTYRKGSWLTFAAA